MNAGYRKKTFCYFLCLTGEANEWLDIFIDIFLSQPFFESGILFLFSEFNLFPIEKLASASSYVESEGERVDRKSQTLTFLFLGVNFP